MPVTYPRDREKRTVFPTKLPTETSERHALLPGVVTRSGTILRSGAATGWSPSSSFLIAIDIAIEIKIGGRKGDIPFRSTLSPIGPDSDLGRIAPSGTQKNFHPSCNPPVALYLINLLYKFTIFLCNRRAVAPFRPPTADEPGRPAENDIHGRDYGEVP